MSILVTWVIVTLGLYAASKLLDGFDIKGGIGSHLIVSALFGLLNAVLGWLLYVVIGIGTFGLGFVLSFVTRLVVSALLLILVDRLSDRLKIKSFGIAFMAALIVAVVGSLCELVLARL